MDVFTKEDLINFTPKHDTFVGIDSDGCMFDTMEEKQLRHFAPLVVKYFKFEPIEEAVFDCVKFVWLYSITRGLNRFANLLRFFERLKAHPLVKNSTICMPDTTAFRAWVNSGVGMSNTTLAIYIDQHPSDELKQILRWSLAVSKSTDEMDPIPPFDYALKALKKIHGQSDALVVSQTMDDTLVAEWNLHGLTRYVDIIAGASIGTKTESLTWAMKQHYNPKCAIMMGDALGDMEAANECGIWFYPILPGHEEASWQRFFEEDYDRFTSGNFTDEYQQELIDTFTALLPETPPWET